MTGLHTAPAPETPTPPARAASAPAQPATRRDRAVAERAAARDRTPSGGERAAGAARLAQRIVLNIAAALGTISIVVSVLCLLFGIRPAVVISGSMEPGIPVGSLTIARTVPADQVEVGDVVTVPRTNADGLVTEVAHVLGTVPGAARWCSCCSSTWSPWSPGSSS